MATINDNDIVNIEHPSSDNSKVISDDSIVPDNASSNPSDSDQDIIEKIPIVGKPLKMIKDFREDLNKGAINAIPFSKEVQAGAKALGSTAVNDADSGQSKLEQLKANYEKYKQLIDQEKQASEERSPIAYNMGKIGYNIGQGVAAFSNPMGMAAKIATGAGLGGVQSASESKGSISDNPEQLAKDIGVGAGLGAASVPVGEAVGKALGEVGEALFNKLKDTSGAKQLAATALNAAKGNSLFGEEGAKVVEQDARKLATTTAQDFTKPISEKNADFTKAFQQAADQGLTVPKDSQTLRSMGDFTQAAQTENLRIPNDVSQALSDLQQGSLTPDRANRAIQQLKGLMYNNNPSATLKNASDNLVQDLTKATNSTLDNTTLQALNRNKQAAWQAVEEGAQIEKDASSMSPEALKQRVDRFIYNIIENAGKSSDQGVKSRTDISQLKSTLDKIQDQVPLGIDTQAITKKIQDLAYLKAASKNVSGIRENKSEFEAIGKLLNKVVTVPERVAEMSSGSPTVQRWSKALLNGDKDMIKQASDALSQNPSTSHLGAALKDPNNKNINATVFSIMQNPLAKSALGISDDNNK